MRNWFKRGEETKIAAPEHKEPEDVTSLAVEPVTHLDQYLAYYIGRRKPGYAVLVTGDWGSGKTFQVRNALPDTHSYYVSLFGLNTPEDVEAQVFTKMFPWASAVKRVADKVDGTSVNIPVWGAIGTGGLAGWIAGSLIRNQVDLSRPLIFDDLERCTVANDILLGLINRYVEHHGCRVIVIAHDTKVVKSFAENKEKVFGQTINIVPNVEAAFQAFVTFFERPGVADRLGEKRREVLSMFRESGAASLRVLRHVVEDVGRLVNALEDRHLANDMAVIELIRMFSALAIETRSNRLERADLLKRGEKIFGFRMDRGRNRADPPEPPAFVAAAQKYSSVDISSTLLGDEVLIEMLFDGRFDQGHIRDSLNRSAYFLEKEAAPPWQVVGSFDKLDDQDVDQALQRMNEQFEKREASSSGEILHIVSLKMMMASSGASKSTLRQVADASKTYIDDLLKAGKLPPRPAGWMWTDDFASSHGGVGYWVADSYKAEFKEVFDHLVVSRIKARDKMLPGEAPALLEVLKSNGQKFFEKVCHTHNGVMEYEDIPILAHIEPSDFVDAWLLSPKTGWYWIGNALKQRRNAAPQYPALAAEIAWYPKVHREMLNRGKSESGLTRVRIERAADLIGLPRSTPRTSGPRPAATPRTPAAS
ncbi:ATP-binding protein [Rhizobium sp. CCGE 510]|uniref:ATP-binding protein n=1 Tax=Rhizobium sp. CCGE 510 TaxID=1132836 RepID=UPI00027B90B1|nr:ATP-binding protein [Rhizobium sp. CCGE 510]EJT06023.1 hypothetical protein RCCGE510_06572 [Rhizobium sp. CCGE 510]